MNDLIVPITVGAGLGTIVLIVLSAAIFSWGRLSVADDCDRLGKFYQGGHVYECSRLPPSASTSPNQE